jgi:hypothetical protein
VRNTATRSRATCTARRERYLPNNVDGLSLLKQENPNRVTRRTVPTSATTAVSAQLFATSSAGGSWE